MWKLLGCALIFKIYSWTASYIYDYKYEHGHIFHIVILIPPSIHLHQHLLAFSVSFLIES